MAVRTVLRRGSGELAPGRAWRRAAEVGLVLALLLLAGALRLHQYDQIPYPNETADEYAYIWSGWSWLHEGRPTAWSQKAVYAGSPVYLWNQTRYTLPTPWLDHPPLYGLIAGGAASLAGAPEMLGAPLWPARLVSVGLGTLAVALLYLLARSAYGQPVALLASLLFATIPTVVVASRLALAESLIVVLMLLALLAATRYAGRPRPHPGPLQKGEGAEAPGLPEGEAGRASGKLGEGSPRRTDGFATGSRWWLALVVTLAAAASLAKVPGVAVGASAALLLASRRRWVAAGLAGLGALAGLLPYFAYGLLANRSLFLAVLADQGGRATGVEVLPRLLLGAAMPPVAWADSWVALLWLALAYVTFRRDRLLAIATVPYLVFLVAAVEQNAPRVWYREPLYPYLCLAGGIFLRDALLRPDALRTALLAFGVTFGKLAEAFDVWSLLGRLPAGHRLYPLLVGLIAAPLLAVLVWRNRATERLVGLMAALALIVALVGNVVVVLRETELYPPYRPESSWALWQPTGAGLVLTGAFVEPTTALPGSWLRVSTTWFPERDVAGVPVAVFVRAYDRRSRTAGELMPVASPTTLTARALEPASLDVAAMLPAGVLEGDWEVGVRVAEETVSLGVIRVRAAAPAPSPVQSVGTPTTFGDVATLGRAAIGRRRATAAGAAYPVLLLLEGLRPVANSYHAYLHLADEQGNLVAQTDWLPEWRVGRRSEEWKDLVVPAGTPAGRYYLSLGLYDLVARRRLRVPSGAEEHPLGVIDVGGPLTEQDVPHRVGARLAGGVELLGYDSQLGGTRDASPGGHDAQSLKLTLYWRALGPVARDFTAFVHLAPAVGVRPVAQADAPPAGGRAPTSTWRVGQVVADAHEVSLAGVPPGQYHLLVGLYDPGDGSRLAVEGRDGGVVDVGTVEVPAAGVAVAQASVDEVQR